MGLPADQAAARGCPPLTFEQAVALAQAQGLPPGERPKMQPRAPGCPRTAAARSRQANGRGRSGAGRSVAPGRPGEAWRFIVPGPPQPKQRARVGRHGTWTPRETVAYEQRVALCARIAGVQAGAGPCSVAVRVWTQDRRRRDLDNILKAILDGLMRAGPAILADDCCTVVVRQAVAWAGVSETPGVEVVVTMEEVQRG